MSSTSFPIVLDLSSFFHDHRRIARVCINNSIKTVNDLKERITAIFSVYNFYLTTGNHFLPDLEDVGILQKNEVVCAIPNNCSASEYPLPELPKISKKLKEKKRKRSLEVIEEESESVPLKNKKAKNKHAQSEESNQTASEDNTNEEPIKKKKGKKKQYSVQEEICNIEGAQRVKDIKKKLKEKTEEHIRKYSKNIENDKNAQEDIKNLLPILQNHIKSCNDSGRSQTSDLVRLSRHQDTPNKKFTKYVPPARITDQYLAKNKINIVKIDIIKAGDNKGVISQHSNENVEIETPPKNTVQEIINSFEKSITPDLGATASKTCDDQTKEIEDILIAIPDSKNENMEFSETTKNTSATSTPYKIQECNKTSSSIIFKNISDLPIPDNKDENMEFSERTNTSVASNPYKAQECNKTPSSIIFTNISDLPDVEGTYVSMDISSIAQNSQSSALNSTTNSIKPSRSKSINTSKELSGLGHLLGSLRESDQVMSVDSDSSTQHVTKRKRTRKRKHKNERISRVSTESSQIESYSPTPVQFRNRVSCPKLHIKFENVDDPATQSTMELPGRVEEIEEESLKTRSTIVLSDENEEPMLEDKNIFCEEYLQVSPEMKPNLEPKIGHIIAFKVLKLGANHAPEVSKFIKGKVERYDPVNKVVIFTILQGHEEFVSSPGRLTMETENDEPQYAEYKELLWSELIEPRLLFS